MHFKTHLVFAIFLFIITPLGNTFAQNVPVASILPSATPVATPMAYSTGTGNYVRTYNVNMITADPTAVTATFNTIKQVNQTTVYLDGLGRTIQTVEKALSPKGYDMVAPAVYDPYGRIQFHYLPYTQTGANDGAFKLDPFNNQKVFYSNATLNPGAQGETVYYTEDQYEASPLNRILKTFAAGNSWASTGGNHPAQVQYLTNTAADSVHIWTVQTASAIPISNGIYTAGSLYKNISIDEQGNTTVAFSDNDHRVILKKVALSRTGKAHEGWLCTYYVYDDLGNMRFVIPPKAVMAINATWNVTQTIADELCFQYNFDSRGRLTSKKNPGSGVVNLVYDTRDRLVFFQDPYLLSKGKWLTTFYDGLNRPVMTAFYPSPQTALQLQALLNEASTSNVTLTNTFPGTTDLVVGTRVSGQSLYQASQSIVFQDGFTSETGAEFTAQIDPNLQGSTEQITASNPLPGITGYQPITYTYYDNYNYPGAKIFQTSDISRPQPDPANATYVQSTSTATVQTTGLVTGTKELVLGTNQWLTNTIYYDTKGREIQTISDNLQAGQISTSKLYDFAGRILSSYIHTTNLRSGIAPDEQILTTYTYDDAGRPVKLTKKLNSDPTKVIAQQAYDELGRVTKKVLGNNVEVLNYQYNIGSSLTSINKDYITGTNTEVNHFGEQISYDVGFKQPCFNGNIAGIIWKGFNTPTIRTYGLSYDSTDRLTAADFRQQNEGSSTYTNDKVDFTVDNLTYDANGNILTMRQQGLKVNKIATIDQLNYGIAPTSNKLQYVYDLMSDPASTLGDFKESSGNMTSNQAGAPDYKYNDNGNLSKDYNKNIDTLIYNHLSLPELIHINGQGNIQYVYNAGGTKLRKIVTDSSVNPVKTTITDYLDGLIYQNDTLQFISHEEGRIRFVTTANSTPALVFDYMIRDHREDIREVLTEKKDTAVYKASMELVSSNTENALFSNINTTRTAAPPGYPSDSLTNPDDYVAGLNAATGKKIGPALVLRVMAGDTIQAAVSAFYKSADVVTRSNYGAQMVSAILQAFSTGYATDGVHTGTGNNSPISISLDSTLYNNLVKSDPAWASNPKAYLNYVLFDDQFSMQHASGVRQVPASPNKLIQLSTGKITIPQTGFLYVYVSNESAQEVDFNNLVVVHLSGSLLEETHYYPFGLMMAGISSAALKGQNYPENIYKFNGGTEVNNDFDINLYETDFRQYDPQIGRFHQTDFLADQSLDQSPYSYVRNNPMLYIDPFGLDTVPITTLRNDDCAWQDFNTGTDVAQLQEAVISPSSATANNTATSTSTAANAGVTRVTGTAGGTGAAGGTAGGAAVGGAGTGGHTPSTAPTVTTSGTPNNIYFGPDADRSVVSQRTLQILTDIMHDADINRITINSTQRSPASQASAMYQNIRTNGVESQFRLYGANGDQVVRVYIEQHQNGASRTNILTAMTNEIIRLGPSRVSRHCANPNTLNVLDVSPLSIRNRAAFIRAVRARGINFFEPPNDPAFHLEIRQ